MRKALALLLLAACTRKGPEPPRADLPAPSAALSAAPAVARLRDVDAGPIAAWTDERAIDGLANSCAFDPADAGAPPRAGPWRHASPLDCRQPFEQACVADPCFHEDEESCKSTCQSTCVSCGAMAHAFNTRYATESYAQVGLCQECQRISTPAVIVAFKPRDVSIA